MRNPVTTSQDADKIAAIRRELPAVEREVYLNTGTNGPLARRGVRALTDLAWRELEEGRIGPRVFEEIKGDMAEVRGLLAELLGCAPELVALTHNTTEGMNIALAGLDWQAGDELVTATSEHEGGLNPAATLKARYGVNVIYTDIGLCYCDPLKSLARALTPRTKAVVLSHVSWATGAVLPLRELCEMAHRVGALVICDAAQACGMIAANVYESGVDAYAISGQKWLCGPDGIGALYLRRDVLPHIQNTFAGYYALASRVTRAEQPIEFAESAQRFQYAAHYYPSLRGFAETLKWLRDAVGWEWVYRRTRELGQYAYAALSEVDGVTLYMPSADIAGLVHFTVDGIPPADVTERLYAQNIVIRHVPEPSLNRIATGFFNTEHDIDRLVQGIRALRQ